jgi:ribonucleoside-diphosphate reductase alpha chain
LGDYKTKATWRLLLGSGQEQQLLKLGIVFNRLKVDECEYKQSVCRYKRIVKVVDENRVDETFCFNEPKRHAGVFNGVFTSNCTEIVEVSDATTYSSCNLASIGLPKFVNVETKTFDFEKLKQVVYTVVENLNVVIDINNYPTPETRETNLKHRPLGIGVQGLADVFILLRMPFDSIEARELNKEIFEKIYFYALEKSMELSKKSKPYEFFKGSPASRGLLQFDLWNSPPDYITLNEWNNLKGEIIQHGLKNSLLMAPMPTASTSQIFGFNSCFEPIISNIFTKRTLSGEYTIINKHLFRDLKVLRLLNLEMIEKIIYYNGSIQDILEIPKEIRDLYKTAYEIKQKVIIDMAADRGKYICQSQSMNLFVEKPSYNGLTNMHFYGWKKGLKTGSYYIRTKPAIKAQKFGIDINTEKKLDKLNKKYECIVQDDGTELCVMCSS